MARLSPIEKQERADFILNRLKRGFSLLEVQKQFVKQFAVSAETSRKWANWACDQITEKEDPATRRRTYNVIVEMYHDQIVSCQNDLLAMQREIDSISKVIDRRIAIIEQLEFVSGSQQRDLIAELGVLPEVGVTVRAGLIEAKSRIRERMYRIMTDLARLRGFSGVTSDWRSALNTLLDNNLLPPRIADAILTVIDDLEGGIRSIDASDDGEEADDDAIDIDALEDELDIPAPMPTDPDSR